MSFKRSPRRRFVSVMSLIPMLMLSAANVHANGLAQPLKESLKEKYPDALIKEVEKEFFNGEIITEVEIQDGEDTRRILLSEDAEILSDEIDNELPIIGGELSLGLGVRGETSIYKGVEDEIMPQPALVYRNGNFELQAFDGLYVDYEVFSPGGVELSLRGNLAIEGFDAGDSTYLNGMDGTSPTFSLGVAARYPTRYLDFELSAVNDVTGEHNGHEIEFAIQKSFQAGSLTIIPGIGVEYLSDKVTDYYAGVSAKEAREDRPQYKPDSAVNFEAELLLKYPLWSGFDLVGIFDYTLLDSTITDSPIVDADYEVSATIGLLYTF